MSVASTSPRRLREAAPTPLLVVALWIGVGLCGGPAVAELPALSERMTVIEEPEPAPALRLRNLDDEDVDLADFSGRLVLVNFWATWCPPCRREMPSMERLHLALGERGLTVLAVDVGEDADTVFAFMGQLDPAPTFPMLFDSDGTAAEAWGVMGLPTSFVVDPEGRIVMRAVGGTEFDDPGLIEALERRLPEPG